MKFIQFFILVVLIACVIFTVFPKHEINIGNVTISWDGISDESKHFSIECFNTETGEVKDAFIISKNLHNVNGCQWYTIDIEGWYNVDVR